MNESPATPPAQAHPARCRRCAYDIRATPFDGVCPECALPVRDSVTLDARSPLDARWLRGLLRARWPIGLGLIAWALACAGFGVHFWIMHKVVTGRMTAMTIDTMMLIRESAYVAAFVSLVCALIGAFLLCSKEPGATRRSGRAVKLLVTAVVFFVSGSVLLWLEQSLVKWTPMSVTRYYTVIHPVALLLALLSGAGFVSRTLGYVSYVCARFGQSEPTRRARRQATACALALLCFVLWAELGVYLPIPLGRSLIISQGYSGGAVMSILLVVIMVRARVLRYLSSDEPKR